MCSGYALAGKRRTAGNIEKVTVDIVLHSLEVAGRDLSRHIQRDPALQPQHQLMEGAVQIVYHLQMQTLFQQHSKTEHIFFS